MISVSDADRIIQSHLSDWGRERIPLAESLNRILATPVRADRDFPPFTRVSMDGIAIRYSAFAQGRRSFKINGLQAAGAPPLSLEDEQACVEVMTGAMLPAGTDTVIRYEDVEIDAGTATIQIEDIRSGQNAHGQGTDRQKGDELIPAYARVSPAEIGVLATVGTEQPEVLRLPVIAIVSTGDELVPVSETPLPYQIRQSNRRSLEALLRMAGYPAGVFHLPDNKEQLQVELQRLLDESDIMILTGGVSKGKFDFLPEVLEKLGVNKLFHRVQQRPGKPFWFGTGPEGKVTFALPGNPVSAFMCCRRYVLPYLDACLHQTESVTTLCTRLAEDVPFRPDLTLFRQVSVTTTREGVLIAQPVPGRGSGDLANLNRATGFIELPAGRDLYPAGEIFHYYPFRPIGILPA